MRTVEYVKSPLNTSADALTIGIECVSEAIGAAFSLVLNTCADGPQRPACTGVKWYDDAPPDGWKQNVRP